MITQAKFINMYQEKKYDREGLFCRESSEKRIISGVGMSSKAYLVYLTSNFALMVGIYSGAPALEIFKYVSWYCGSAVVHSAPYFVVNELFTTGLNQLGLENFFITHSLSAASLAPFISFIHFAARGIDIKQSRLLTYRYLGTLCCASLVGEMFLSYYKYNNLQRFTLENVKDLIRRK